ANVAEWNGLKLSANQLRALGEIKARELGKDAKISGGLSIASLNLREFLEGVGVELPAMQAGDALNQFELVSRLNGSSKGMMFEELNLKLDGSTFTGKLGVSDFAKQALR
ncbi:AsmA family protein, partial [Klebsiella pneumoniae]